MRRREYLAAAGASGLAGCLEAVIGGEAPPFRTRRVAEVSVEREPTEHDCRLSVELLSGDVDPAGTARFRATIANDGDAELPLARLAENVPNRNADFSRPAETHYLLHPDDWQPERREDCWTPADSGFNGTSMPVPLPPGESRSVEYWLWDPHPRPPCWPTGAFHFGARYWPGEPWTGPPRFRWLLSLRVESAGAE